MPRLVCFVPVLLLACQPPESTQKSATFDDAVFSRLDVRKVDGTMTVNTGETTRVNAILHWLGDVAPEVNSRIAGGTLLVESSCPTTARQCSVDYEITVPPGIDVDVLSEAGDVTVRGIEGFVDLVTRFGDVNLIETSGYVRVDATTGNISLTGISGRFNTTTTSGTIDGVELSAPTGEAVGAKDPVTLSFDRQPDLLEAYAASGTIEIEVPTGEYDVDVTSRRGALDVQGLTNTSNSGSVLIANTTTGDIKIVGR